MIARNEDGQLQPLGGRSGGRVLGKNSGERCLPKPLYLVPRIGNYRHAVGLVTSINASPAVPILRACSEVDYQSELGCCSLPAGLTRCRGAHLCSSTDGGTYNRCAGSSEKGTPSEVVLHGTTWGPL